MAIAATAEIPAVTAAELLEDILNRSGERRKVVYVLTMIDRIGQLAGELFFLINLFDRESYELTVITLPPERVPRVNKGTYRLLTRGLEVRHSEDGDLIWKLGNSNRIIETPRGTLYFASDGRLFTDYLRRLEDVLPRRFFSLNQTDLAACTKLRRLFGIPPEAPVVTLHVREGGYLPNLGYHSYRDADITTYYPALRWLIDNGYYVVRLGDKSMKPLDDFGGKVVDGPHHPLYENDFDTYFVAMSRFYLGMHSGPYSLARGFGVPMLITNAVIQHGADGYERDILIFKKYRSRQLDRFLSYEEVAQSPALYFCKEEAHERAGLELVANSPEEILEATQEMALCLDGTYGREAEIAASHRRVKAVQFRIHVHLERTRPEQPFYALYWLGCRIGQAYLDRNPWFLGHDFGA